MDDIHMLIDSDAITSDLDYLGNWDQRIRVLWKAYEEQWRKFEDPDYFGGGFPDHPLFPFRAEYLHARGDLRHYFVGDSSSGGAWSMSKLAEALRKALKAYDDADTEVAREIEGLP